MAYKYISDITKEELSEATVIRCVTEDNRQCIVIRNSIPKTIASDYNTDKLIFRLNKVLYVDDKEYYVHLIECKSPISNEFDVVYDYVFGSIKTPIDDDELFILAKTIDEYFKTSADPDVKSLQIGVFGELLTIKKLFINGYKEILEKYHKDFYSKHDVEVSETIRLEIKTTPKEKRIHEFKHNQIYREDIKVYIASSVIEIAQEGLSLNNLFNQIIALYNSPVVTFELEKLRKRCHVDDDNVGIIVAENKAMGDLLFFDAENLPRFECAAPNGVTNVRYDVDCSMAQDICVTDLIGLFKFDASTAS